MNRDNQQQTVSDFEIGWLAGIIEGEGSICLQIHKRNNRSQDLRVTPKIIITNSDKDLIESSVSILDRMGVGKWVCHTRPNNISALFKLNGKKTYKFKEMTYIHISGLKRVQRLLNLLTPHILGEKKERAIRLKKFIDERFKKSDESGKKMNYKYDQNDVDNMVSFMELTVSPNKLKIKRMLNDYTGNRQVA